MIFVCVVITVTVHQISDVTDRLICVHDETEMHHRSKFSFSCAMLFITKGSKQTLKDSSQWDHGVLFASVHKVAWHSPALLHLTPSCFVMFLCLQALPALSIHVGRMIHNGFK